MDKIHLRHLNHLDKSLVVLNDILLKCEKNIVRLSQPLNEQYKVFDVDTETMDLLNKALIPVLAARIKELEYAFDNYETLYLTKTPEKP